MSRGDEPTVAMRPGAEPGAPPPRADELPRGAAIGRYLVLGRIGEGGMGVVYAAYDPELDRRIAIKVLRFDDEVDGTAGRARMQREAQALARLSHPNVIAIFDVGPLGGGLFLAMELVEGGTLRTWQAGRPWREVLDGYLAAGRGLAAAHAAGLVHRDFKAENVLVGKDGRFRVTDFGLVRAAGELGDEVGPTGKPRSPLDSALTQAGAVMGTLHYMSPEQLGGEPADARSDQFGFCVALWEALFGDRPYAGDDPLVLRGMIEAGDRRAPPAATPVPPRLVRALERGLAFAPDARWPSVAALLDELAAAAAPPARPRLGLPLALAGAIGAGALVVAVTSLGGADDTCAAAGAPAREVWTDAARERVRARFASSGAPFAADAFAAVDRAIGDWLGRWAIAASGTCRAVHVDEVETAAGGALRERCLDARLDEVAALVDALAGADLAAIERAPALATTLPELGACADAAALAGPTPPPAGAARARVDDVGAKVARLAARARLVDAAGARALLPEAAGVVAEARAAAWPPGTAEALLAQGTLAARAGDAALARAALAEAASAALAARDDDLAVRAMLELTDAERVVATSLPHAEAWGRLAVAAVDRLAEPDRMRARALFELGEVLHARSDLDGARAALSSAVELAERTGDTALALALRAELAEVAVTAGAWADAQAHLERALPAARRELGERHPRTASLLHAAGMVAYRRNDQAAAIAHYDAAIAIRRELPGERGNLSASLGALGAAELGAGRDADGLAHLREALAIVEAEHGAEHADVARALSELGGALHKTGDHAGALAANERAVAILERALGPDHPDLGYALVNRAMEAKHLGRTDGVEAAYRRALAIFERARGAESIEVGITSLNLGELLRVAGDLDGAAAAYERARTVLAAGFGEEHVVMAHVWAGLGQLAHARGRAGEAVPLLERAVAMREADGGDAPALAEARLALARALVGIDRERAQAVATAARDGYAALGAGYADERAAAADLIERIPR